MIKKVIFFRYLPLTQKVYNDYYLGELKDAGFEVEYWYLPFIIKIQATCEVYNHETVRTFRSYKELNSALKQIDKKITLFISIQTYYWSTLRLFWVFTKNKCLISVFGKNTLPSFHYANSSQMLIHLSISRITSSLKNIIASFLKKMGVIKSYDILFLAGKNGINGYGYVTSRERNLSKHILINSDDYDRVIENKSSSRIMESKYIVFLDQCLPLHPDIPICGIAAMDADIYYAEINTFFDKVEKEIGLPVVIAAHPKALIYKKKDYYKGRLVIFGKTVELVRDSEFVFAHNSTAISYVVGFNKKLLLLTSDAMARDQFDIHMSILGFSTYLDSQLIYMNRFCQNNNLLDVSKLEINIKKYNKYKYDFLTNIETQNQQSSELVIRGIKCLEL